MNDRILFSKVSLHSVFLIFQSNLFQSIIIERKEIFLKKSCFTFVSGILLHRLVLCDIFCVGIIE